MKKIFRWLLLRALRDELVRESIMQIVRESQPAPPRHRPISKNTAPGAI